MAAYAALVSLLNVIDNIQNHPRLSISLDKKQVQSLCDNIEFLLEFIESDSDGVKSGYAQVLEREIACAAYAVEDVIESHVVDEIQAGSVSLLDLQTVIRDIDCVKEKVVIVKEQRRSQDVQQPTYGSSSSASATPSHVTNKSNYKMVGFNDELTQLLDELTGHQYGLQIIPIVGMGGIGKTTLARAVFENPLILQKFDTHSWVTISQQYSVTEIFSKLLISCPSGETADEHELGERLYKSLIGRRYLIVLDDMWSLEAWHKIKRFFPDNKNRSRILVTTRLSDMAAHFGTCLLTMKFLDEAKSWELFCEKAFPGVQGCPPELEKIGKMIVKKCKGLPLSIAVIGALVSKSSSMEYWENISSNMNSILDSGDESLDILSLSYGHLPAHLKPCFLYMGVFPEDCEIRVSRLIQLWVSEGFVKPIKTESLEEIAEGYLKDLIDRNLILVRKRSVVDGKMETCQMHDLLRDLCLKTAEREKFMCVMKFSHEIGQGIDKERRFVLHETIPESKYDILTTSLTRSLVSMESLPVNFKLLRVMDIYNNSCESMEMVIKQVNLRCVSIANKGIWSDCNIRLHLSSILWNLQTVIIVDWNPIIAPPEIWEMRQLRHVDVQLFWLPDPPRNRIGERQDGDQVVLRNLHTLKKLWASSSHDLLKRIPNAMELEILYDGVYKYFPESLGNEDLQLRIMFWLEDDVKRFKEKQVVQQLLVEEGFTTTTRLQICKYNFEYKIPGGRS